MSRIAKKPILVFKNIKIKLKKNVIFLIKDKLIIKKKIPFYINLILSNNNKIINLKLISNIYNNKLFLVGTFRSILNNIIIGLYKGFKKKLILVGIGYKAYLIKNNLCLNIGYSHIINYLIPKNIEINCPSFNEIVIKGYDKQLVGQVASRIRSYKPPENYRKGKGIRYLNELVRIKEYKKKTK